MILPVYDIQESKWKDVGTHLSSYVKLDGGDQIVMGMRVKDFKTDMCLVCVSASGMIKRTLIRDLEVTRLNKTYTVMNLKGKDTLVAAFVAHPTSTMIVLSRGGYGVNLTADQVSIQAPKSQGVKAINLKEKDFVACACSASSDQEAVVIATEKGSSKRIKAGDISLKSRPVMGELIAKRVQSNPNVVKSVQSGSLHDIIRFYDQRIEEYLLKDIPLMSLDQTYSNSVSLQGEMIQPCIDVEVLIHEDDHDNEKVERISLELE